jgi:integrase
MPRVKLTELAIHKLRAPHPDGKQTVYWDLNLRGFGVQCSGISNAKAFVVQADHNGKTKRATVGRTAEMTLIEARQSALAVLADLRKGISPGSKPDNAATLRAMLESYLQARRDLRPASIRVYRQVERTLAPWMDWPLREITPDMVERRHREIAKQIGGDDSIYSGESTANSALRVLRILWNFAADRILDLPPNPVRRLRKQWFAEPRRTRMIPAARMPDFYQAVCGLDNETVRDFLLLLIFTGLRKGEASSLRWDDIDLDNRTMTLGAVRTKSKRALQLPLSDFVHAMLKARQASATSEFVFPAVSKSGYISDLHVPQRIIAEQTGIMFSAHDLRRGFATVAEGLDISMTTLKALLNHAPSADVTTGYIVLDVERLRRPMARIAKRLEELCGISAPVDNVARLPMRLGGN